jgi:hypothetical protein
MCHFPARGQITRFDGVRSMASVSGSKLAFFAPGFTGDKVNVVLTSDGTNVGPTVAGSFNIEVFTSTAGAVGPGFQGSDHPGRRHRPDQDHVYRVAFQQK